MCTCLIFHVADHLLQDGKKAEDIAKHKHIRDTLKIYTAMKVALTKG